MNSLKNTYCNSVARKRVVDSNTSKTQLKILNIKHSKKLNLKTLTKIRIQKTGTPKNRCLV